MKAVFYIKLNGKVQKSHEEELSSDIVDIKYAHGIILFTDAQGNKVPRTVEFVKMTSAIDIDGLMFMFDADLYLKTL